MQDAGVVVIFFYQSVTCYKQFMGPGKADPFIYDKKHSHITLEQGFC